MPVSRSPRSRVNRSVADTARPRVCVTPVPPNGASLVTTVGTQKALDQVVTADGLDRAVDDGECRGTQSAEWSADGLRLFARAQVTCAGDSTPRGVTGLALLAPNGTWLDIQAVDVGGRENVRVRRYRRVLDETGAAAVSKPHIAAARLRLADIKEASAKISPRAIEAALVETNAGFDLTGRDLIGLDDAGVAGSVVDILVALSYPDRFVVERTRDSRATGGGFFSTIRSSSTMDFCRHSTERSTRRITTPRSRTRRTGRFLQSWFLQLWFLRTGQHRGRRQLRAAAERRRPGCKRTGVYADPRARAGRWRVDGLRSRVVGCRNGLIGVVVGRERHIARLFERRLERRLGWRRRAHRRSTLIGASF